jgi:hypothetical protein
MLIGGHESNFAVVAGHVPQGSPIDLMQLLMVCNCVKPKKDSL